MTAFHNPQFLKKIFNPGQPQFEYHFRNFYKGQLTFVTILGITIDWEQRYFWVSFCTMVTLFLFWENSVFRVQIQKNTKIFGKICQTFEITKLKEKNPLRRNMVLFDNVSYLCHF